MRENAHEWALGEWLGISGNAYWAPMGVLASLMKSKLQSCKERRFNDWVIWG